MAKLSTTTQDNSRRGNLRSWSELFCAGSPCFFGYFRLMLLTATLGFTMTLNARELTGVLDKTLIPAFPGAEGAGAFTPGGRGGRIFEVTHLNDTDPTQFVDYRILEYNKNTLSSELDGKSKDL